MGQSKTTPTQTLTTILQQRYPYLNKEKTIETWGKTINTYDKRGKNFSAIINRKPLPIILRALGLRSQVAQMIRLSKTSKKELFLYIKAFHYYLDHCQELYNAIDRGSITKVIDGFSLVLAKYNFDLDRYEKMEKPVVAMCKRVLLNYIDTEKLANVFEKLIILQKLRFIMEHVAFLENKHHEFLPVIDNGLIELSYKAHERIQLFYKILISNYVFNKSNYIEIFIQLCKYKGAQELFKEELKNNKQDEHITQFENSISNHDAEEWLHFIAKIHPNIQIQDPMGKNISRYENQPFKLTDLYTPEVDKILHQIFEAVKDKLECSLSEWKDKFREENTPLINWKGNVNELKAIFFLLQLHRDFKIISSSKKDNINQRIKQNFTCNGESLVNKENLAKNVSTSNYISKLPADLYSVAIK
ncbi:hypothetical protein [Sediminitomix flava]|uniref:Uncharacterized protein n=1 Tax=Sediminitomix flava TaxID=379075 RepID=A0A315Z9J6_SEDFL|nr:hypothetical protein [Sediminitomix flava]PWJ42235.1 hypothetical protein BC781_103487 [Sediminitomix flava]